MMKYVIAVELESGKKYCRDIDGNILKFDKVDQAKSFIKIFDKFHKTVKIEEVEDA